MSTIPANSDNEDKYFFRERGKDGVLRKYDMRTGECVEESHPYEIEVNHFKYTAQWNDIITSEIRQGKTISAICSQVGYPSISTVHKWRELHPDFKRSIQVAKQDRAEAFADMALEIALNTDSKDHAQVAKVQIDTLKWLAEKNNPTEYGSQTKITGDTNQPVGFAVISTGIVKDTQRDAVERTNVIDASCREVDEDGEDR